MVTDPAHVATARQLRRELTHTPRAGGARRHADGHTVALRALPDYDALFGVDFTTTPAPIDTIADVDDIGDVAPPERKSADGHNNETRGAT